MATFEEIINKKSKEWSCPGLLDRSKSAVGDKIPFSSPLMNYCTYGGIPRNQITEFFGAPGGGKSTTAQDICKRCQILLQEEFLAETLNLKDKIGKGDKASIPVLEELEDRGPQRVLYVDLEHTFDYKWAGKLGIVEGDIDVMQPPDITGEELLQTIEDLICTGQVGMVVIDSIPSIVTKQELEKKIGERTVASLAGLMTIFLRKIVPKLTRYRCTLLLINQTRPNMDNPYVVNTPGGEAIKFYSGLRVFFKVGPPVDFLGTELPTNADNPAGYKITAKIAKQKTAPWDRKNGSYFLMARTGIRADMDYAQLAVNKYGIIRKAGAWFTVCDPTTGEILEEDGKLVKLNGMAKVYDYLQTHPEYFELLRTYIVNDIEQNGTDEETVNKNES